MVKDLGVDSAGGRRRRITTQAKRFGSAARRNKRLHVLRLPRRPQRTRAYRASILTAAVWGHEGQGIAPKRLKIIRAALSRHAGRTVLGSVDVSFNCASNKVEDPLFTIVRQHACTLIRIYAVAQPEAWSLLAQTWKAMWHKQSGQTHGWRTVKGLLWFSISSTSRLRPGYFGLEMRGGCNTLIAR